LGAIPLHHEEIEYPTSDGQPMAETTLHRKVMTDLIDGLEHRFRDAPDVWVGGNLFLYFERGNPRAVVAPDVLLVKGVPKWDRPIYKLWEEGVPPCLVVEVTSDKTRHEDLSDKDKKGKYLRLGVEEYFLFDPYGDYLEPRLQGYLLERGRYVAMTPEPDGALSSRTTGLRLEPEGLKLRLVDPATGERYLWREDKDQALEEKDRALQAAEDEIARLRRKLERH
jgi:Uma2 family endonuclease